MENLKMTDIKNMDEKVIVAKVSEFRRDLFNMRMQRAAAGVEKPHVIKLAKKNIARLLTAKNSKGGK